MEVFSNCEFDYDKIFAVLSHGSYDKIFKGKDYRNQVVSYY